jgi:FkbM family methyltransferase
MALNRSFIAERASLGASFMDKLHLALFGLLAPSRRRLPSRWRDLFASMIPNVWLKPKRLSGLRLSIHPVDWSQTVIFEEVFLKAGYDLSKVNFKPEAILDCGAHIGMFSLLAKMSFPSARIVAYEPNPRNIRFIRRQIVGNRLDIDVVEAAVSIETKEEYFAVVNSHSGRLSSSASNNRCYKVKVVDFPAALKKLQPSSLLLKMDVEGEERNILPVLVPLLPKQCALFFETHAGESGWREIETLLISNGFRVEQINARGEFWDGFAQRQVN